MAVNPPPGRLRLLLIGDGNSIWVSEYVHNVAGPSGSEIVLASYPVVAGTKYDRNYRQFAVRVVPRGTHTGPLGRVPIARRVVNDAWTLHAQRRLEPFDVVHVHCVTLWHARLATAVARRSPTSVIYSTWGSDVLRSTPSQLRRLRRHLLHHSVRAITYQATHIRERASQVLGQGTASRLVRTQFGVRGIDHVGRIRAQESRAESRNRFGIPRDAVTVTVGYNASVAQHHLEVLDALGHLSPTARERLFVLLPWTYRKDGGARGTGSRPLARTGTSGADPHRAPRGRRLGQTHPERRHLRSRPVH